MPGKAATIRPPRWQQVNTPDVEAAVKEQSSGCGCELPIFVFRTPGKSIEGRIRPCYTRDRNDRARCAHIHSNSDGGEETVFAIRMSCMIWAAVCKADQQLWGRIVRITYQGNAPTKFGHYRKIFKVEVDKGSISEEFEQVPIKPSTYKSKKPRKRRPINRPAGKTK